MRKYECVLQDGPKDCGICSLLTIIKSYGGLVSKEYLRSLTNTNFDGVNALSLLDAGRKLGFYTEGVKGDILKLDSKYLPCIAHVIIDKKYKHFVVIHNIDKKNNYITIADPSRGILKLDIDKFKSISTNTYLLFIPNKTIPIMKDENLIKRKLVDFIYNNKNTLLIIMLFSLLYTFVNLIISFNFQFIIDWAISVKSMNNIYFISFLFIFIYSLKNILEFSREKLLYFITHKMNYIVINDSLNHILSLPHIYFKNRTTGEVLSRISDLDELKEILSDFILTIFVDLFITVITIITLFSISKSLFFFSFIILLLYSIFIIFFNRIINYDIKKLKEENSKVNSIIIELINGINTIKGLNILEKIKEDFSIMYNNYLNTSYNFTKKINNKKLVDNIVMSIISLIIFTIGGSLVIDGKMSLASLISFNAIIIYNMSSLKNILNFDILLKKTKIIIERINELLNIKEENIHFDLNPIKNLKGDIVIKKLSYKYNDNFVIDNLNITINEGKKILIYGNSGCGKSTLAKILAGYLEIKRNKVFIGQTDIKDINLWSLREQVTYVSQEEYIFNNTLFENINIRKARDINKINDICKCMLIDEITSNSKNGYNMLLEENASNLSGGERQRVILARTFLKNSSIYILDETFSQINVEKERIILQNIFERFKDKTIIVISHRFDNNELYDCIYDMEKYENRNISKKLSNSWY